MMPERVVEDPPGTVRLRINLGHLARIPHMRSVYSGQRKIAGRQDIDAWIDVEVVLFGAVLVTNDLCPAGTDSTNTANYDVEWFNFHVVVRIGESARSDACSSYLTNLSGAMHLNPVFLWSFPGYWQTWIPVGASGFYTGLANAPSGPYDNVVESVDRSPKAVY